MKKQEFEVYIPGVNEKRRFLIPDNMQIGQCIHLLVMLVKEEYPGVRINERELRLYRKNTGEVLEMTTSMDKLEVSVNEALILG